MSRRFVSWTYSKQGGKQPMMKIKDILCLLAGVALLVLAFQIKGFAEEIGLFVMIP